MEQYNKQASQYIFRANNAQDKVPDDTIDLHGQFVEEAEDMLEARIRGRTGEGSDAPPRHCRKGKPLGQPCPEDQAQGRAAVSRTGASVQGRGE